MPQEYTLLDSEDKKASFSTVQARTEIVVDELVNAGDDFEKVVAEATDRLKADIVKLWTENREKVVPFVVQGEGN